MISKTTDSIPYRLPRTLCGAAICARFLCRCQEGPVAPNLRRWQWILRYLKSKQQQQNKTKHITTNQASKQTTNNKVRYKQKLQPCQHTCFDFVYNPLRNKNCSLAVVLWPLPLQSNKPVLVLVVLILVLLVVVVPIGEVAVVAVRLVAVVVW